MTRRLGLLTLLLSLPLMLALGSHARPKETFLMPVGDVFSISGRGTVAVGVVERGAVAVGDVLELVGPQPAQKVTVLGIELKGKSLTQAQSGQEVGLVLRGVSPEQIRRGHVLATPGAIKASTRASAKVAMLASTKGGLSRPVSSGFRPQLRLRNVDFSATVHLPESQESLEPGQSGVLLELKFDLPVPIEKGQRFEIRQGGKTVGEGEILTVEE